MNEACKEFVTVVARAIDAEPAGTRATVRLPHGAEVGQQIVIDITEADKLLNRCKLSIKDVNLAPAGEAARVEYEHDKATPSGTRRVYSVQSVRQIDGQLRLYENFMSNESNAVREEDFQEISSVTYAQDTLLKTLNGWVNYRAWQLQQERKK